MCQLKKKLEQKFEIMNEGDFYSILGIQII
jgi:hypothetical protein